MMSFSMSHGDLNYSYMKLPEGKGWNMIHWKLKKNWIWETQWINGNLKPESLEKNGKITKIDGFL